jgi:uncharacterized membrane protein YesL
MATLRVVWQSIKYLNARGYIYIWANLYWIVLSLPIVTAPAAWAALNVLTHRAQTRPSVSMDDFMEGFRTHFKRSLLNGLLTLCIVIINVSNLLAYSEQSGIFLVFMRWLWLFSLLLWFSMQLYLWAIIEEMKEPSLWGGLRNAFIMTIRNLFFTMGLWLVIVPLLIVSVIFFPILILLTGSLIAILAVNATLYHLRASGYYNPEHFIPVDERI